MLYIALNIILKRLFNVSLSLNKMIKLFALTGFIICITFTGFKAFNTLHTFQEAHLNRLNSYLEAVNK